MTAVLLGCGRRRSEVAALTFAHVQQRDGRWCIVTATLNINASMFSQVGASK